MNPTIKAWLRQPTTIHGIGALVGVGASVAAWFLTHDAKTAAAVAGSAFGVVCMAMNDSTGDKSSVEQLATDAIQAIVTQRVGPMLPTLGADVVRVLQTPPAAPAATPAPQPNPTATAA
jgi:hypothetical protein